MSRWTLDRHWTDDEVELARKIVVAISAGGGSLVGSLSVARAAGLPFSGKGVERSRRLIYDVMPLAALLTPSLVPGKALVVELDHTYRITDAAILIRKDVSDRAKKLHTSVSRMAATFAPLAASTDPVDMVMLDLINTTLAGLDPDVWEPIIAAIEKGSVST